MARLKLTDKHIKRTAAPAKGRTQFFDTEVKRLVFRVTAERKHDDGATSGAVRSFPWSTGSPARNTAYR